MPHLHVQYGCGHEAPETWLNFESSPTLVLERLPLLGRFIRKNAARFPANVRRGDIVRGPLVPTGSAALVYCSHTLEHLALEDCRAALRHTLAMLRPGGRFRLVLTDLEALARTYVTDESPTVAHAFMENTMLGVPRRARGLAAFLHGWLGGSHHLWMWDYKALRHELVAAGFTEIRRAKFGDSTEPRFSEVEDEGRWAGALGIECMRPPV